MWHLHLIARLKQVQMFQEHPSTVSLQIPPTSVSIYTQHHVLLPAQNQNLDYLSINLPVNCLSSQHSCFSSGVLAVLHSTRDFSLLLASSCVIDRRGAALTMLPGPCSALHLSEGASILHSLYLFSSSKLFIQRNSEWKTWEVEGRIEQEKCIVRPSMLTGPWIVRNTENQRTALAHRS